MSVQLDFLPALEETSPAVAEGRPLLLSVDLIDEDPAQPRREFDAEALGELAATIAARGVRQPVSVRPHPQIPGRWMLNFGARRLRASKLAGKAEIPAFVDEMADSYDQVIENEHREALRPMELALFVKRQLEAGQSQADVARELGKSRAYITYVSALIDPPDWLMEVHRSGKCRGVTELYDLRRTHAEHPEAVMRLISERAIVSRGDIARLREQPAAAPHGGFAPAPAPVAGRNKSGHVVVLPVTDSPPPADRGSSVCREGTAELVRQKRGQLVVLAELEGRMVTVALDDLPIATDEVFVIDEGAKNPRTVKLSEVQGLRLRRE